MKKLNILVADDTGMHRSLLKSALRSAGTELGLEFNLLSESENGDQLVKAFQKEAPGTIHAVFSDIRMPELDGLSALVKIKQLNPQQIMVMVSSEDMATMTKANIAHGEQARKTLEEEQKMALLNKVADRIRKDQVEDGKTNSILTGCEKLALDPIWVAKQYGASGYLKKPYDLGKTKDVLKSILVDGSKTFIARE